MIVGFVQEIGLLYPKTASVMGKSMINYGICGRTIVGHTQMFNLRFTRVIHKLIVVYCGSHSSYVWHSQNMDQFQKVIITHSGNHRHVHLQTWKKARISHDDPPYSKDHFAVTGEQPSQVPNSWLTGLPRSD